MAAYDVLSFNGTALGSGTDYDAWLDARDEYVMTSSIDTTARRSASPLVTGTAEEGRTITLHVANAAGSALTAAQFRDAVKALFDPRRNSSARTFVIVGDDGVTDVQTDCYVAQVAYLSLGVDQYVVTLWSPSGVWQATTETSDASPATVTNVGNTIAYPTIELTTGTHVTRRACTVQAAAATLPLISYPIVFALNDANATSTNTLVFIEGDLVPCYVDDSGAATSRVWALVDAVADRATNVDIIYGTGLVNPLDPLSDGGMDWDDAARCTNTQWEWNDWAVATIGANPPRPGVWRVATTGNHSDAADVSFQVSGGTVSLGAAGTYDNSGDSLRLRIEGSLSNVLTGLSRQTSGLDGVNARAFVIGRQLGTTSWTNLWTQTANATVTTVINSVGTIVELAIGLENFGATADPSSLIVSGTTVTLTLIYTPTVVVGAAANMDRYDGEYTIGDRTITFSDYLVPDGTLTIDCENRSITSSVDGPVYWIDDELALQFSHPDQWMLLLPGANSVTDGLSATDTVSHRAAFT